MRSCTPNKTTKESLVKLNVYSIFDNASGLYSRPFFTQADGEAVRHFSDIACDDKHPVGMHPADYTLFRLGIFDDVTGNLTDELNSPLTNGLECASRKMNEDKVPLFDERMKTDGAGALAT